MNTTSIDTVFTHTTVDPGSVRAYLLALPQYYECGHAYGSGPLAMKFLSRLDDVEFELKEFLAGQTKNRYYLNRAVHRFMTLNLTAARAMTEISLNGVQDTLLTNQWYEIMPRFQATRRHIEKLLSVPPVNSNPARP